MGTQIEKSDKNHKVFSQIMKKHNSEFKDEFVAELVEKRVVNAFDEIRMIEREIFDRLNVNKDKDESAQKEREFRRKNILCEVCNKRFVSTIAHDYHMKSKKHLKKLDMKKVEERNAEIAKKLAEEKEQKEKEYRELEEKQKKENEIKEIMQKNGGTISCSLCNHIFISMPLFFRHMKSKKHNANYIKNSKNVPADQKL